MKLGIDAILTIILGVLKITGVIHISWWLVFLPMIATTAVLSILLIITGAAAIFLAKEGKLTITKREK